MLELRDVSFSYGGAKAAGHERRGQDHAALAGQRPGPARVGGHPAGRRAAACPSGGHRGRRGGAGARGAAGVHPAFGARKPGNGRLPAPEEGRPRRARRRGRRPGPHAGPVSGAGRAHRPARGQSFRRRAADAGHGPRPDGPSAPAAAGRAQPGPCPQGHGGHLPGGARPAVHGLLGAAGGAERAGRAGHLRPGVHHHQRADPVFRRLCRHTFRRTAARGVRSRWGRK